MGVDGLWKLLDKCSDPISLETLENKILAIDTSIWLNQAIKGIRGRDGVAMENTHLLGMINRICKLLHYKIKPVFVFDGSAPLLKRQTIAARQQRSQQQMQKNSDNVQRIVRSYLQKQVGKRVPLPITKNIELESNKLDSRGNDEMFILPSTSSEISVSTANKEDSSDEESRSPEHVSEFSLEASINADIDIHSAEFAALPAEVRHEILVNMKTNFQELEKKTVPKLESNAFSKYQLTVVMQSRNLQKRIEETRDEMMRSHVELDEQDCMKEGDIFSRKLASDSNTKVVYIKHGVQQTKNPRDFLIKKEDYGQTSVFTKPMKDVFGSVSDFDYGKSETNVPCLKIKKEETESLFNCQATPLHFEADEDTDSNDFESVKDELEDDSIDQLSFREYEFLLKSVQQNAQMTVIKEASPLSKVQNEKSRFLNCSKTELITLDETLELEIECKGDVQSNSVIYSPNTTHTSINEQDDVTILDNSIVRVVNQEIMKKKMNDEQPPLIHLNASSSPELPNYTLADSNKSLTSEQHVENEALETNLASSSVSATTEETKIDTVSPIALSPTSSPLPLTSSSSISPTTKETKKDTVLPSELSPTPSDNEDVLCLSPKKDKIDSNKVKLAPIFDKDQQVKTSCKRSNDEVEKTPECSNKFLERSMDEEMAALRNEIAKVKRQTNTVRKSMIDETKELLELFGIPYIVSPTEAEAQCAALELQGITNGTITDDSDIWLFGAQTVYKNFFNQSKFVCRFTAEEIQNSLKLSRDNLICIAMLCGSDYTEGIKGIGPVSAMEILSEFRGEGLETLKNFSTWWKNRNEGKSVEINRIRKKFIKYSLPTSFPSRLVFDAYMHPVVNKPQQPPPFGRPDLDLLRQYTYEKFGWSKDKADKTLLPVMKRINEKITQSRIDNFFQITKKKEDIFDSSRLKNAIKKIDNIPISEGKKKRKKKEDKKNELLPSRASKVRNQKTAARGKGKEKKGTEKVQKKLNTMFKVSQTVDLSEEDSSD